ncbi:hypothetical protein JIN86_13170 [Lysinibacillus sp. HST-98]|uniref:hypothetical protein n=1 Tax=Lysinibacillus sp. HST-98 TaxID=2800419 RepID=UPI001926BA98|nr:hypothetical protein [Lysinibacillus sp. HST-98]MBL3730554.1 hypothetical protein [Lysinibacillus sp. HST-98]
MNWRGGKNISEQDLTPEEIDVILSSQKKFNRPASQLDIQNMTTAITLELEKETKAEKPNEQIIQQLKQLLENYTTYTVYINDNSADSIFYSFYPKKKRLVTENINDIQFLIIRP